MQRLRIRQVPLRGEGASRPRSLLLHPRRQPGAVLLLQSRWHSLSLLYRLGRLVTNELHFVEPDLNELIVLVHVVQER